MKSNRKALLALIGAIIAAVAVAYGTGTFDRLPAGDEPANMVGSGSGTGGQAETAKDKAPAGSKTSVESKAGTAAPSGQESASEPQQAAETPAQESETAAVQVPGFDLLRVEPGGDMVIAGNAAPGSKIEIVNGSDVLTTAEAGSTGDFVAVLDERLKPGDYQIVLRATGSDGTAATSTGTAIVSVPETPDGEVLALVEEPGKASRLISSTGGTGAEVVDKDSAAVEVADAGRTEPAGEASGTAQAEQPAPEAATPAPAAEETAGDGAPAPAAQPQEGAGQETQMAAADPAGEQPTEEGMAEKPDEAPQEMASAESQAETETPAETPRPAAPQRQSDVQVAIEAVEIEGSQVFVAGAATPGHVVRVYANNILLGDARTSQQGRFLIETRRDLPEGDYIIRADVLAPNRADVIARAAVPFQRTPGENIAAVARPPDESEPEPAESQMQVAEAPAQAAAEEPPATAEETPATAEPASDSGKGGRVTAESGSGSSGAPAAATEMAGADAPQAGEELQLPQLETALSETPPDITAPALQPVDRSVIIRRGDTLWHISRRVYGRGIRYTTIYKANSDQIRDPDLIFPGQVFDVPEKSENGEPADMSQLKKQDG